MATINEEIISLIAQNKFREIFKLAKTSFKKNREIYNDFILLEQRYNRLINSDVKGIISHENYNLEINKISNKIINLIEIKYDEEKDKKVTKESPSVKKVIKLFTDFITSLTDFGEKFAEDIKQLKSMINNSAKAFSFETIDEDTINMGVAYLRKNTIRMEAMQKSLSISYKNHEKAFEDLIEELRSIVVYFDNSNIRHTESDIRGVQAIIGFLNSHIKAHDKNKDKTKLFELKVEQDRKSTIQIIDRYINISKNEKITNSLIDCKPKLINHFDHLNKYNPLDTINISIFKELKGEFILTYKEMKNNQ